MKINFTKEHFNKMCALATEMLLKNEFISTKLGQPLNVVELMHTTTVNTLNDIKNSLTKKIQSLEEKDEWVEVDTEKLDWLKTKKELVNLIVGWKRFNMEQDFKAQKKAELTAKLSELRESQKTPEDRIKEMEAELASLNSEEF